jgi:hypothetical protein
MDVNETKILSEFFNAKEAAGNPLYVDASNSLIIKIEIKIQQVKQKEPASRGRNFYKDEEYSDLKLISSDTVTFFAHRVIVATKSVVLKTKMDHCEPDKPIVLDDVNEKILEELLKFTYMGEIGDIDTNAPGLLKAATTYEVSELKEMCIQHLVKKITIGTVFDILKLADECTELTLRHECLSFIKSNYFQLRHECRGQWEQLSPKLIIMILDFIEQESSKLIKFTSPLPKNHH